jgi:hypothetical protein
MAIAKANELTPYYDAGEDVTGYVTSAVTGKRFVKISGNRQAGPALNTSTSGGNVSIAPPPLPSASSAWRSGTAL